ncbi:MAG: porphobilinogen synthase [Elusimicrobia bacterium]|nr:porphobilinogen synthase [Elusimicrobiota bacterium]
MLARKLVSADNHKNPPNSGVANLAVRLRRLRQNPVIRAAFQENRLSKEQLMAPLFVREGSQTKPSGTLPGHPQRSLPDLLKYLESFAKKGGRSVIVFGIPAKKDALGTGAYASNGIVQKAIRAIKKNYGEDLVVAADLCFCEYTDHGHCGVLRKRSGVLTPNFYVDNDATLDLIGKTSVSLAEAGADIVAPSGMIDGMVAKIRSSLDRQNFKETIILSYAAKYASTLYGPFRELAQSKPSSGDRKSYQMNPANAREALREMALDAREGADILMVKPALFYLDILAKAREEFDLPLAAFQVSGEAWMIEQYARSGMAKREDAILESLMAIRRAGADLIITYFAEEALALLSR